MEFPPGTEFRVKTSGILVTSIGYPRDFGFGQFAVPLHWPDGSTSETPIERLERVIK